MVQCGQKFVPNGANKINDTWKRIEVDSATIECLATHCMHCAPKRAQQQQHSVGWCLTNGFANASQKTQTHTYTNTFESTLDYTPTGFAVDWNDANRKWNEIKNHFIRSNISAFNFYFAFVSMLCPHPPSSPKKFEKNEQMRNSDTFFSNGLAREQQIRRSRIFLIQIPIPIRCVFLFYSRQGTPIALASPLRRSHSL